MNQKEALTILYDATVEMDHLPHIRRARKVVCKRIEVLRQRYERRLTPMNWYSFQK